MAVELGASVVALLPLADIAVAETVMIVHVEVAAEAEIAASVLGFVGNQVVDLYVGKHLRLELAWA
jgi:hypothetical protein